MMLNPAPQLYNGMYVVTVMPPSAIPSWYGIYVGTAILQYPRKNIIGRRDFTATIVPLNTSPIVQSYRI